MFGIKEHRRARLELETLEDRVVPSAAVPDVDLSTRGAVGEANQALFRQYDAQPTGTGVINSFVRLQAKGATTAAHQGFNTDARPLQFDENKSPQFTRSLKLADVPEVNIGGVLYREFLLDINQKASQPFLSLDELRLYVGDRPDLANYNTTDNTLDGLAPVFDLDAGADRWVKLDARLNQGSGKGDALVYIPSSAFAGQSGEYLYLYSKFGLNFMGNAGFEEWAVAESSLICDTGTIQGFVVNQNNAGMADVTLFIDANNNGLLDDDEVYTTTDLTGYYAFHNLSAGLGDYTTYRIRQVVPEGYTQTSVNPEPVRLDQCGENIWLELFTNEEDQPPPPPPPDEEEPPTGPPNS